MAAGSGILRSAPDSILPVTQLRASGTARRHNPPRPFTPEARVHAGDFYSEICTHTHTHTYHPVICIHTPRPLKKKGWQENVVLNQQISGNGDVASCRPPGTRGVSGLLCSHTVPADKRPHLVFGDVTCRQM